MVRKRRSPRPHKVNPKHSRYNVSQYNRGSRTSSPSRVNPVHKGRYWVNVPEQQHAGLKRWLETEEGDIISVVTGNPNVTKRNRMGIDGEIRVSMGDEAFSIPASLQVVARKSDTELIRIAERRYNDIQRHKKSSVDLKQVKTYKGDSYFPTSAMARTYALEHGLPTQRIIHYDRGWAIQRRKSGLYWDVKRKQWS